MKQRGSKETSVWGKVFQAIKIELKLEALILAFSVLIPVANSRLKFYDKTSLGWYLTQYFDSARLESITTFLTITIGIYVAIVSIFSTTTTSTSEAITETKNENGLIIMTGAGLIESLLFVVISIFLLDAGDAMYYWIAVLIVLALVSLCKFLYFVVLSYKYNLISISKNQKSETQFRGDLLYALHEIEQRLK